MTIDDTAQTTTYMYELFYGTTPNPIFIQQGTIITRA